MKLLKSFSNIFLVILITKNIYAGVGGYNFSASTKSYVEINGTSTVLINSGENDFLSSEYPIGFNFVYDGLSFSKFKVSSNGFITLNTNQTSSIPVNSLASNVLIIAPLWDDLSVGERGFVHYQIIGTAPNRVLKIEFKEMKWNYLSSASNANFQILLYESSNKIEYIYGTIHSPNFASASIGISDMLANSTSANLNNFHFISITPGNPPSKSSVTENVNVNSVIPYGTCYTFTPPIPISTSTLYIGETGNYATLQDAFDALRDYGITTSVTLKIISEYLPEANANGLRLDHIPGSSATNKVYLKIDPGLNRTIVINNSTSVDYTIRLRGVQYFTIDGTGGTLTFVNEGSNPSSAIKIMDGTKNCIIKNVTLKAEGSTSTLANGVVFFSTGNTNNNINLTNDNNIIENCLITRHNNRAANGVLFYGGGTAPFGTGNRVINCIITNWGVGTTVDQSAIAIRRGYVNTELLNNEIYMTTRVPSYATQANNLSGISTGDASVNVIIKGNKIYRILPNSSTSNPNVRAIRLTAISSSQSSLVANNFIALATDSNITNGTGVIRGISDESTGWVSYYNNSVRIGGTQTLGAGITACFFRSSTATNSLLNNIFFNERTNSGSSTGKHYAIYRSSPSGTFSSNYNDLYVSGTGGAIGYYPNADRISLADWRAVTGQDMNSVSVNPLFVGAVDLHLDPSSQLESFGTPIEIIGTDIDGDYRHTNWPDIGADEFDGYPPSPFSLIFPGNNSINNQTSILLRWSRSVKARMFDIYIDTLNPPTVLVSSQNYNDTVYQLDNLKKNTTYYWNVRAKNAAGETNPIPFPFTFTTGNVPDAPANLIFTVIGTNSVTLSWTDLSDNESGFRIYRANSLSGPYQKLGNDLPANSISYIDNTVKPNVNYYYRVLAFNEIGEGNFVSNYTVTLAQTPNVPQITGVGYTWLTVIIDSTGNSSNTLFAIYESNTQLFVQSNGVLSVSPYWQTYSDWGRSSGFKVRGLNRASNYSFQVKAKNLNDIETPYGVAATAITLTPIISYPYFNNFEGTSNENWVIESNPLPNLPNPVNDWTRGNFTKLNGPYSPTKAWVTKLSGYYSSNHHASLVSPQFDFSSFTKPPTLSFYHNFVIEQFFDAGVLEYTIDEGITWQRLGNYNDPNGINWYNNDSTGFGALVTKPNWSGTSSGWKNARLKLTNLVGVPSVQFRFRFGTDVIGVSDGWAIDDFRIIPPSTKDIQVVEVTVSEPRAVDYPIKVFAKIRNLGTEANPNSVSLTYKITTAPANQTDGVNQVFSPNWSGDSAIVTFDQALIRTSTGTVKLYVRSFYSGDEVPTNDSVFTTFTVNPPGLYFAQGFEATTFPPNGWSVIDANNDGFTWKRSTSAPFRGVGHVAYSYNTQNITIGANDWLFTPALQLDSSRAYSLKFYYRAKSSAYPERFKVTLNTKPIPDSIVQILVENNNVTNTDYYLLTRSFGVDKSGLHYIGFHCYSAPYMWDLYIDSVRLEITNFYDLTLTSFTQAGGFPTQELNKSFTGAKTSITDTFDPHVDNVIISIDKLPIIETKELPDLNISNKINYFKNINSKNILKLIPNTIPIKAVVSNVGTQDVYNYSLSWNINNISQPQYSGGFIRRFTGVDTVTLNYIPLERGTFRSRAWTNHSLDTIRINDTLQSRIRIYPVNSKSIAYDKGNDYPQSMIGLNRNGKRLTAGVRFSTDQVVKIGNVDVFYTNKNNVSGDTYQSNDSILVQIWSQGVSDSVPGNLLYAKKFGGQNYITSNVNGEAFSLPLGDDAPLIPEGVDYWISVTFDSVLRYPAGVDYKSTGRSFFSTNDGASWSPLVVNIAGNMVETAWWLRSVVVPIASVSGTVYCDSNGNGIKEPDERGIPNIKIYLSGGKIDSTITDSLGFYYFLNLEGGTYNITQKLPSSWIQTYPNNPANHVVTITSSNSITGKDFGNLKLGSISGRIVYDDDGDGIINPFDDGLSQWKVYILKDLFLIDSTYSDNFGGYSFTNLLAGNYIVYQEKVHGFIQTFPSGLSGYEVFVKSGSLISKLDFGNYNTTGIAGVVFHDLNANGLKDFGEPGLSEWLINLYRNGEVVDSRYTDSKGGYLFSNLEPATYQVSVDSQESWYQSSPSDSGFYTITLNSGDTEIDVNFGVYKYGSISGLVFNDKNGNKAKDESENFLANVRVYISGLKVDSTLTDSIGSYNFTNLIPGEYLISIKIPVGWTQSFPESVAYHLVKLKSNEVFDNKLFGLYELCKISGFLYNDFNGDGIKNNEDLPLVNWLVRLSKNSVMMDSVLTDSIGYYEFKNLMIGEYFVQEKLQQGWIITNPTSPNYHSISLIGGDDIIEKNFLNFKLGKISGNIFNDQNSDGIKSIEETNLQGWKVYVSKDGLRTDSTLSDYEGNYIISGLTNGEYSISQELKNGWIQTVPVSPSYYNVEIFSGAEVLNKDFGNFGYGNISGLVFNDIDANGAKGLSEPGINSWVVKLFKGDQLIDSTVTNESGYYLFRNLEYGAYQIKAVPQSGWLQTSPTLGYYTVNIFSGDSIVEKNFGFFQKGAINGLAFNDMNGNGQMDTLDYGLSNFKILLYKNGFLFDSVLTDINGNYSFTGLAPGVYTVSQSLSENWIQTFPYSRGIYTVVIISGRITTSRNFGNFKLGKISGNVYEDDNFNGVKDEGEKNLSGWMIYIYKDNVIVDSLRTDIHGNYDIGGLTFGEYRIVQESRNDWVQTFPISPNYYDINILSGTEVINMHFGNYGYGSFSGKVFNDVNGNGLMEQNESGLQNFKIMLYKDEQLVDSVLSDEFGFYSFNNLLYGNYKFVVIYPEGWIQTIPTNPDYYTRIIVSRDSVTDKNFGFFKLGEISGFVYNDYNANGIKDSTDNGLEGFKVMLYSGEVLIDSIITDINGYFKFTNLYNGTYIISQSLPTNWIQTFPALPEVYIIAISSGSNVSESNFGNFKYGSISGIKYNDINGNGLKDFEEPVISDWKIYLLKNSIQMDSILTDISGKYYFGNLIYGEYTVKEYKQSGWICTSQPDSINIEILSGTDSENNHFGNFKLGSISGSVFEDVNDNGVQDSLDNNFSDWKIHLYKNNIQIDSTFTDTMGNYRFLNLGPGIYTVSAEQKSGWTQTTSPQLYIINITSGLDSFSNDFGFRKTKFTLNLKLLIEGLYNESEEKMIQDSVLVELRGISPPYPKIGESLIIIDSTGIGVALFDNLENNKPYYIAIKHRNSIETWSATAQIFTENIVNYDFTSSQNKAYGNNLTQKALKWCIYSGDCYKDGWIDGLDMNLVDNDASSFIHGYNVSDINGDGWTDGLDMNIVDNNSAKFIYAMTPENLFKSQINKDENGISISKKEIIYSYSILNDTLLNPYTYEFDIYLKNLSDSTLEVANTQMGINFNGLIRNNGKLSFSIVAGSSDFLPTQVPQSFSVDTINNILRAAPRANPSYGNGTIISKIGNGTRLGRFRITNTVPFDTFSANLTWNFISTAGKYPTRLSAYINRLAVEITNPEWHYVNLTNPIFNINQRSNEYQKSWNIVSVPLRVNDYRKSVLFPTAISSAFAFENQYVPKETLSNGLGYWIKFDKNTSINMYGKERLSDTVYVATGWNLIGTLSIPTAVEEISSVPSGIIISNFYGYMNGYFVADTLKPFYGYWIKVSQDGKLILNKPNK